MIRLLPGKRKWTSQAVIFLFVFRTRGFCSRSNLDVLFCAYPVFGINNIINILAQPREIERYLVVELLANRLPSRFSFLAQARHGPIPEPQQLTLIALDLSRGVI